MSVEKEIGLILRQARESNGLSLDELQEKTRVQRSFLVAIEDGEFHKLPSPFFVRSYLRNYCTSVKMEPHHILRQYRKAEQAERGLTGVHQAITPEMLGAQQQLQQTQPSGQNTMMGTGLHSTIMQQTQSRVSKTSAHTALTIAKVSPTREMGYKQRTDPLLDRRQRTAKSTPVTPKQTSSSARSTLEDSGRRPQVGRYAQAKSDVYQSLSRKRSHAADRETIPPRRVEKAKAVTEVTQSVSQMPSLSRSSMMRRRPDKSKGSSGFKLPGKRSVQLIIASAILLIPLLWVTVNAMSDDKSVTKSPTTQGEQKSTTLKQPAKGGIEPNSTSEKELSTQQPQVMEKGNGLYEVTGSDEVKLGFHATGDSWIQVRNQQAIQKRGFLNEATLRNGDIDNYTHLFAKGNEIWITLANPQFVKVTANGEVIRSSKTIRITKK